MPPKKRPAVGNPPAEPPRTRRATAQSTTSAPVGSSMIPLASIQDIRTQLKALSEAVTSLEERYTMPPAATIETPAAVLPVMQSPPSLADPVTPISGAPAPIQTGTNPSQFVHNHFPWVDTTTLTHITSGMFDPAHLIKLIPTEDRPPVKNATSSTSGILLDIESSKVSLVADENPAFEKHFPTFQHFLIAITVYGAVRDIYDRDNVRFGTAVLMYTRQLATWLRQGLSWRAVLSYAIAHFRKYQSSTDPNVWIHIDPQLMSTTIVTRQAVFHSLITAT